MVTIEHSRDGRIATLTLNRPDRRNALNQSLVTELTRVVHSLGQDEFVRVIILTGAGSAFSAGADLDALQRLSSASDEENLTDSRALAGLFLELRTNPKFVLAMVNGHAIAGGSGLVAACDGSVAVRSAKLGFTEVRIGFVPALVSVLLRSKMSETHFRDLFLTGRLITADEALQVGLVTKVVADEQLQSTAWEWASSIARNTSSGAVAMTKSLLASLPGLDLAADMEMAAQANAAARRSSDCLAGVQAFLKKKQTPWASS